MILADTAFGSVEFQWDTRANTRRLQVYVTTACLLMGDVETFTRGQQVRLVGLKFPVSVSWYYLKRDNGKRRNSICSVHQTP